MAVYRPTYTDPKTGTLKQQRVWWYEFSFAGCCVRESSKSTRKTIAVEAEDNRRRELQRAYAGQGAPEPAAARTRTVRAAMEAYQRTYPVNHRAKSVAVVKERAPHLEKHLGSLLMPDLTEERIKRFMADRRKEGASNRTIKYRTRCTFARRRFEVGKPLAKIETRGREPRRRTGARTCRGESGPGAAARN
jgi:hypothetical protein